MNLKPRWSLDGRGIPYNFIHTFFIFSFRGRTQKSQPLTNSTIVAGTLGSIELVYSQRLASVKSLFLVGQGSTIIQQEKIARGNES